METADPICGATPIAGQPLSVFIMPQLLGKALANKHFVYHGYILVYNADVGDDLSISTLQIMHSLLVRLGADLPTRSDEESISY